MGDGYVVFRAGCHEGLAMNRTSGHFFGIVWLGGTPCGGTGNSYIDTNININVGKWHSLAMSANDSKKLLTLYLDGKPVKSQSYSGTLSSYGNIQYHIGGSGSNYLAWGIVDDAMFFGWPIN